MALDIDKSEILVPRPRPCNNGEIAAIAQRLMSTTGIASGSSSFAFA